jgi:hypothetical protein
MKPRERDLLMGGGVLAAAGAGYFLLRRPAPAPVAQGSPAIPADPALSGAGAGGGGGPSPASDHVLTLADITSALAAAGGVGLLSIAGAAIPIVTPSPIPVGLGAQAPIGATPGVGTQIPAGAAASPTSGLSAGAPIPVDLVGFSNTGAAYDAVAAALLAAGAAATPPSTWSPALQAQFTNATGIPTDAIGVTPTGQPAGSMAGFTGVVGTSGSAAGMVYNVYKNGQLVAAVPGTGSTDTSALALQYGLNPGAPASAPAPAPATNVTPAIAAWTDALARGQTNLQFAAWTRQQTP